MHKNPGFHLIEILIVLAIIGILTAMTVPMYSHHLVHERRLEAIGKLTKLALAMEKYHFEQNTYQEATLAALHFPAVIARNHYRLHIQSATETAYLLAAEPLGAQAEQDNTCATLLLSETGKKDITGSGDREECWQ